MKGMPVLILFLLTPFLSITVTEAADPSVEDFAPPKRVSILPVFLLPPDTKAPTQTETALFMKHLTWTQRTYKTVLKQRSTFRMGAKKPEVVPLKHKIAHYKNLPKGEAASEVVAELLNHYKVTRFKCPWIFCCVLVNWNENWPVGGGRPINGGLGRGGGIVLVSLYAFTHNTSIQATLRHEIGHAIGLPHVDVYGYDQRQTPSIMAYHKPFKTLGLRKAPRAPQFIPEDLRALALNSTVLPGLKFSRSKDIPANSTMHPHVIPLGPMKLPGHPDYGPTFQSSLVEKGKSKVEDINSRDILPSSGPGVNFNPKHMWLSAPAPTGDIDLTITFPGQVRLTAITLHTQHSGRYNRANAAQIQTLDGKRPRQIKSVRVTDADMRVEFPAATAKVWRLILKMKPGRRVCVRGLQFFSDETELFPPQVPYGWRKRLGFDSSVFPARTDACSGEIGNPAAAEMSVRLLRLAGLLRLCGPGLDRLNRLGDRILDETVTV